MTIQAERNDGNFRIWMRSVDRALERKCGLCSRDLEDIAYRDLFDDGVTPSAAASRAIRNSKWG